MAEAHSKKICIPNKVSQQIENWHEDRWLLHSETYVGGCVQQLRSGIFRHDISEKFIFDANIIDEVIDNLDDTYGTIKSIIMLLPVTWLKSEANVNKEIDIVDSNWPEIRDQIRQTLQFYKQVLLHFPSILCQRCQIPRN